MQFETTEITPATLLDAVRRLAEAQCRFVALSQTVVDDATLRLLYHFDENRTMSELRRSDEMCHLTHAQDGGMRHLRMDVPRDAAIPSITGVYPCAALAENETQDMYGVRFEGLALDYGGAMYLEGDVVRAPFFTMTIAGSGRTADAGGRQ